MTVLEVATRAFRPTDRNLVLSSYVRSYELSPFAKLVGHFRFMAHQPDIRDALVGRSTLMMAHLPEEEDAVVGWAMWERPGLLHYVFVKPAFRRAGVARRLLAGLPDKLVYTHETDVCEFLPIPSSWTFDHYLQNPPANTGRAIDRVGP